MEIKTAKIHSLLRSLSEVDRMYLDHTFAFSQRMREIIEKYEIEKEEFCRAMGIKMVDYNDFISGGWNYDVRHMAKLEALHQEKFIEAAGRMANEMKVTVIAKSRQHEEGSTPNT